MQTSLMDQVVILKMAK